MLIAALLLNGCSRYTQDETRVIRHMHTIQKAEDVYYEANNRYAALAELDGLIDRRLVRGVSDGYAFTVVPGKSDYTLIAKPRVWNVDGQWSFFSDESKIIVTWTEREATRKSPVLR